MSEFQDKLKGAIRSAADVAQETKQRQVAAEVQQITAETERICKQIENELLKQASLGKVSYVRGQRVIKTDYISLSPNFNIPPFLVKNVDCTAFVGVVDRDQRVTWNVTAFAMALIENIKSVESKNSIQCDFKVCITDDPYHNEKSKKVYYYDCSGSRKSVRVRSSIPECYLSVSASSFC